MSHYCCAVFANTPDDFDTLLEPYNEENEKYFEFEPVDEEKLHEKYCTVGKEAYDTFESYVESYGYCRQNGVLGYMSNPNGKWDWYSLDGKDYMFDPKPGEEPDETYTYKKSQIDFYAGQMEDDELEKETKFWNEYVLGECKDADKYKNEIFKPSYYLNKYGTLEQYLKAISRVIPYAFITPDGEWIAPGEMGWFGLDNATSDSWNEYVKKFDDFVKNAPDCYVTFADLHI